MDCSIPGLSVLHHLPKFAQVHAHCMGDAIQPFHPLMPTSPSALNLSQHQGLFQWVSCSLSDDQNTGVSSSASVLPMRIEGYFPKIDWLDPLNVQGALSSVQFSHSVVSDSLQRRGLKHARLPYPLPIPGAYSNSCPLSRWCYPTISSCHLLLFPPSIFPSIRVFSNESALHTRWPKYWSFSFNISPSNEYPGLISFRMDWVDLFAVQGTLKSLLQHHSLKASILWHSAFFIVQL